MNNLKAELACNEAQQHVGALLGALRALLLPVQDTKNTNSDADNIVH